MRIGTGIYVKGSCEAVELYTKAFNLTLGYHVLNPDGSFYHSELMRGDDEIISVIESKEENAFQHTVQISVILDSEQEVRNAFDILKGSGTVEMPLAPLPWSPLAAVVADKFGVWWYITAPQHYPDEDFKPNEE